MSATNDVHDRIEDVSNATADGPHLVTLAVPPEQTLDAALELVEEKHAEAEYIDADETSERATEALERTRRILNDYEETPENGLVVYAGVVDAETVDYVFDDLPSPVGAEAFERSNEFDTDPLDVAAAESTYGLLVVEHGEATLGTLRGDEVEQVATLGSDRREDNPTSGALGDREQGSREFFERVAERAEVAFLGEDADEQRRDDANPGQSDVDPVEGLFVGGSDVTATEFLDEEYLDHRLQSRVVGDAVAVGDASEKGLRGLAEEARERLEEEQRRNVDDLLDEYFAELVSGEEAVAGREATDEALEYEGVATTLAAGTLPTEELRSLEQRTVEQGGEFVVVPTDVDRSEQFREEGDVGALLRFPVD
ncbi:hypothetical protein ACFO0N_11705 [Halobium salinum]|uniref:eRF1/Pelota-like N-terminal domain-containing protein n=1 Tax=Halobium salinum TaxID=1364940 RepID=A0ABD5PCW9_9EURY|nr:peptide chain release factor 1 [Halobium salinum]